MGLGVELDSGLGGEGARVTEASGAPSTPVTPASSAREHAP
jgi:hypothetical protein